MSSSSLNNPNAILNVGKAVIGGIAVPPGGSGLQMIIGFSEPFVFSNTTAPPVTDAGFEIADISSLIPYLGSAVPPSAFPTLSIRVGNFICGYNLGKEFGATPRAFPATGTLFIYLSVDGSKLNEDGTVIAQCIPFSNVAELINDVDTNTPSDFTNNVFGSIISTATSLRLMVYYSTPTEAEWAVRLTLGAVGVQPINAILRTPPP